MTIKATLKHISNRGLELQVAGNKDLYLLFTSLAYIIVEENELSKVYANDENVEKRYNLEIYGQEGSLFCIESVSEEDRDYLLQAFVL